MKIICIGLNKHDFASIGKISGNYGINLIELNDYRQLSDVPGTDTQDAFIIKEKSLPDKGIDLSQYLRLTPGTSLAPIFAINTDSRKKKKTFLPMALDRSCLDELDLEVFEDWLHKLLEKDTSIVEVSEFGLLQETNILEVLSLLHESGQSGELLLVPEDGGSEGRIWLREGEIINASIRHLEGEEAFFEILSLDRGKYEFSQSSFGQAKINTSFPRLLEEGLKLLREASLLWSLIPGNYVTLVKTDSESALADSAEKFFAEKEATYNLIDGSRSIDDVVAESPLSMPRAFAFIAQLISLGDAEPKLNDVKIPNDDVFQVFDRIKVLVVDDSKLVGSALTKIFSTDPRFEILGQAFNGLEALEMIENLDPDVVTLDVEMPEMDGLTALKHIMIKFPRPVVMISSLTQEGSHTAFEALRYGAVDIIPKPSQVSMEDFEVQKDRIRRKVLRASEVSVDALHFVRKKESTNISGVSTYINDIRKIYAIGTGLGGYNTLLQLIPALSADVRASYVVMTQIDPSYLRAFVRYVDDNSDVKVKVAEKSQHVEASTCYLGTPGSSLVIENNRDSYRLQLSQVTRANCQKMSLDSLFSSLAESLGKKAGAVILSGKGNDGVNGICSIAEAGGSIFVQKPESCLEPELPTKVLKAVSAARIVRLRDIPRIIEESCR